MGRISRGVWGVLKTGRLVLLHTSRLVFQTGRLFFISPFIIIKRAKYPLAVLSGYSRRLKQDLGWRLFVFFY